MLHKPSLPLIIDADALMSETQLHPGEYLIIDIRSHALYRQGHIPGAVWFDPGQLAAEQPPVRGLLPSPSAFAAAMRSAGVKNRQHIVVYDNGGEPSAGRFAWTLLAFNHREISMLNGGIHAWQSAGYPLETTETVIDQSRYDEPDINQTIIADRDSILATLNTPDIVLLDTRSAEEFSGQDIRSARGGHIPGAININWTETKNAGEKTFKSSAELKKLFSAKGITPDKQVICYCQSHQRSALVCMLLMSLGYNNIKGYPGAWSDWGNQTDTPIES